MRRQNRRYQQQQQQQQQQNNLLRYFPIYTRHKIINATAAFVNSEKEGRKKYYILFLNNKSRLQFIHS